MAPMAHQASLTHSVAFLARRAATALAAVAVLGAAAAPAAYADAASASPKKLPDGLYGTKDPQYDGVWRQSLALLAQDTVGIRPAPSAVKWLAGQQCADGSFTAFRAAPGTPCDAKTGRDTNQTAAAVQALAALGGHGDTVRKAVGWLKSVQNDDGGWSSMTGSASDANSTSVVIGALAAAGEKPGSVTSEKGGKTPTTGCSPSGWAARRRRARAAPSPSSSRARPRTRTPPRPPRPERSARASSSSRPVRTQPPRSSR